MATEKQIRKLIGRFLEHVHLFKNIEKEDTQWAIRNPKEAIKTIVAALADQAKVAARQILKFRYSFILNRVSSHSIDECFESDDDVIYSCELDFEGWTPRDRKAHMGGVYDVTTVLESSHSIELAAAVVGVSLNLNNITHCELEDLQRKLINDGHCVEMKQIDIDARRCAAGEMGVSLSRDGYTTVYFVDNYNDTVSVVYVHPDHSGNDSYTWKVVKMSIENPHHWQPGSRVVSCN